jgi:hypothetical protein
MRVPCDLADFPFRILRLGQGVCARSLDAVVGNVCLVIPEVARCFGSRPLGPNGGHAIQRSAAGSTHQRHHPPAS